MIDRNLQFSESLRCFFKSCETECRVECCGIDAFDFSRERLLKWLRVQPQQEEFTLLNELGNLMEQVRSQGEGRFAISGINTVWSQQEWLKFLASLRENLSGTIKADSGLRE